MRQARSSLETPETCPARWALFLDVDGTLLDFAETPDRVAVAPGLPALLERLQQGLGGALALVSGRPLAVLDRLFAPHRFAAAGVHGIERRDATGRVQLGGLAAAAFEPAREVLRAAVAQHPGLLLEDKGHALAVHFRLAPQHAGAALAAAQRALGRLPQEAHLQHGNHVIEIKSRTATKGTAVRSFMHEPPFAGRTPVMVGDDITDEDAFDYVESVGGQAVAVGAARARARAARMELENPSAVRAWLRTLAGEIGRSAPR